MAFSTTSAMAVATICRAAGCSVQRRPPWASEVEAASAAEEEAAAEEAMVGREG